MDPSEMHDAAIRALDVLHALARSESEGLSASLRALDTLEAKALDEVKSDLDSRKDDDHHQSQLESSRTFRLLEQVDAQLAVPLTNDNAEPFAEDPLPRPKRARTQRSLQPGLLNGDLALALMHMPEVQIYEDSPQHLVGPKRASQESTNRRKPPVLESSACDSKGMKVGSKRSSMYNGVSWNRNKDTWKVRIRVDGVVINLGSFTDEKEAARKYDEFAISAGRPVNFPDEVRPEFVKYMSSKMKGVSWCNDKKKWMARIHVDGKSTHLGCFDDKELAAQKYDDAARSLGRPMNYPPKDDVEDFKKSSSSLKSPKSRYRGVSWSKKGRAWRARISFGGKYSHLGHFHSEEEAAIKYDEAAAALGRPLNFSKDSQVQAVKLCYGTSKDVHLHGRKKSKLTQAKGASKCTHLGHSDTEDEAEQDSDDGSAPLKGPSIVPEVGSLIGSTSDGNFSVHEEATETRKCFSGCNSSLASKPISNSYTTPTIKSTVAASTNTSNGTSNSANNSNSNSNSNHSSTSNSSSTSTRTSTSTSKRNSPISSRAHDVANFWKSAVACDSATTSGSADAPQCSTSAAHAAYNQVPVVDAQQQPGATSRLRENRLSGVPTVIVGHHGWAGFADAWLVAGGGADEAVAVLNSVSANSVNHNKGSTAKFVSNRNGMTVTSPDSTKVEPLLPSESRGESRWVPSANDEALAAGHGIRLCSLLNDIGDEEVPLVQPRTFIGSQQARGSSTRTEHLASAVMTTTVGDFVRHAWLAGTPDWYMHQWQFPLSPTAAPTLCHNSAPLPLLGDDLSRYWLDTCRGDSPFQYLFFGHAGSFTKLHRDAGGLDIVLQALTGRKECILVHRDDTPSTYNCDVNLDIPDLNAHPLFAFARVWRHVLAPGELLYLPAGTFHFCRNLEPCLSYSRFHLDTVNLPQFYKSYIDRDAPEIEHGELLWNAAVEIIRSLDMVTDTSEVTEPSVCTASGAASGGITAVNTTAIPDTTMFVAGRQVQSLAALRHTFAALHQRRTDHKSHAWASLIHDIDICLADFYAACGTNEHIQGMPSHWWQPGKPQSLASSSPNAHRTVRTEDTDLPQQSASALQSLVSPSAEGLKPSSVSAREPVVAASGQQWQIGDRATVRVARRYLTATVTEVLPGKEEAAMVRYDGWPQRFDELQRRDDLRSRDGHDLSPSPAPFPATVLVRWGMAREPYPAAVVGKYHGPLVRVSYEDIDEDWDQWVKPRQLRPLH